MSAKKYLCFLICCLSSFSSVAPTCLIVCDPMNHSTPGLPVHHQLPEFTQAHVHRVGDAIQPSHPLLSLLLLTPIPPSIRAFSNESTLHMRWPKYWSFSFSISPSKEIPGLISFRMTGWVVVVVVKVTQSCPTLATPGTVACQTPLSMGFSRQEYWSGVPFPSPADLTDLGIEPASPAL